MALPEVFYAVLLHGRRIGTLCQKGDYTRFVLNETYLADPRRPVLGLRFEEGLRRPYAAALRLPKWFSNLLPEGPLRQWIADDRGVALDREMELLAQVGHDLPGAVQIIRADGPDDEWEWVDGERFVVHGDAAARQSPWRFSVAGVALKFSMLAQGDRMTVPAFGDRGDWIVKFPDYRFKDVPRNEHTMMLLAEAVGIDVPEVRLVHRDELEGLPSRMWPNEEEMAYAVKRFDRLEDDRRTAVHIEDLAQVRDVYPQAKYEGSYETVASLIYRGRDLVALREFARRLAYSVLIGNGDAHLKNWSLIYRDQRIPTLSPAYDLVSTPAYRDHLDGPEDLGLRFCGSKRFESVQLSSFARLEARLDALYGRTGANLVDVAVETTERVVAAWPQYSEALVDNPQLRATVSEWIGERAMTLRSRGR